MSTSTDIAPPAPGRSNRRRLLIGAAVLAVLVGDRARHQGREDRLRARTSPRPASRPRRSAPSSFPGIKESIVGRAVDAKTLPQAVAADKAAAATRVRRAGRHRRGDPGQASPASSARASPASTTSPSTASPARRKIRMQTGPAINGTDLRDATGEIKFGDFKNQIEYQNAGAAINNAMKQEVLAGIDTARAAGQDRLGRRRLHPRQSEELAGHAGGDRPSNERHADREPRRARGRARRAQRRQVLRRDPCAEGRELRHPPRPGDDALRRERRRQVDADEGPLRRHPPDLRRDHPRRQAGGLRLLDRRARPRHLDHPPGAQPRAEPERARQHLHGPRDPRRRPASTSPRRSARPAR